MTEKEKVIKGLECCLISDGCKECPYNVIDAMKYCKAEKDRGALALLKAQNPVKPNKLNDTYWCGKCGRFLCNTGKVAKTFFCTECGTEVNWDG